MSEKKLCPNPDEIEKFLNLITQQWRSKGAENCLFEVRCLGENKKTLSQKFSYKKIPDAVEFAKRNNCQGMTVSGRAGWKKILESRMETAIRNIEKGVLT